MFFPLVLIFFLIKLIWQHEKAPTYNIITIIVAIIIIIIIYFQFSIQCFSR